MQCNEIAEKLGVTHQRLSPAFDQTTCTGARSLRRLDNLFWIVMRAGDKTPLLSFDQERVLSAIPREYSTTVTKIRIAARMPENKVERIIGSLTTGRLVNVSKGLQGNREYRLTASGLRHPQHSKSGRCAEPPRLPVELDRVRNVLSAILDVGTLRIRDVMKVLGIERQSIAARCSISNARNW